MNRILLFFSVAVFSIFLGSQITEGFLLVPYWKTLSKTDFYEYHSKFGPIISEFYTVLTVIAVLIPLSISVYCLLKKSHALKYSVISSFFAFLIIIIFYAYFKNTNQQFHENAFNASKLKLVLETWGYWHWVRVVLEILSLVFLILSFNILSNKKRSLKA